MSEHHHKNVADLCDAILLLNNPVEVLNFLKDLCTPQEIAALAERWRVCQLLDKGNFSYREIHSMTGASLTTIGRVARFLKDEPYQGYVTTLKRMKENMQ
jgi:TrpR-related protein YerC/YecD